MKMKTRRNKIAKRSYLGVYADKWVIGQVYPAFKRS